MFDSSRRNTPEVLEDALAPARADGVFGRFSFGADFTASAQQLMPALHALDNGRHSKAMMLHTLLRLPGAAAPDAAEAEAFERMKLGTPHGLRERVWRAEVLDALRHRAAIRIA